MHISSLSATVGAAAAALLLGSTGVSAHGFLLDPETINFSEISFKIDDLRNPVGIGSFGSQFCRDKSISAGKLTEITLRKGETFNVKLAMSVGAEHVGPCFLDVLLGADGKGDVIEIAKADNCAGEINSKGSAKAICPDRPVRGLVTDDMCAVDWPITVLNDVPSGPAILRWRWIGQHVSPGENYENCARVTINGEGSAPSTPSTPST
ncbi:hypothetical protein HK102_014173, partial [Quaeritorhiza haematococci]